MVVDPARVRASYDRVARQFAVQVGDELSRRPLERSLLAALAELAGLAARPGLVADLGAGPGHVAAYLHAGGVATVAVDLSPAMAAIARHDHGLPAVVGNVTALPVADGSLAAAIAFFVLIHLADDEIAAAAAELARVLRPGGVAIVSFHVGDEVRHLPEWHGHAVDLDFRFFSVAAIRGILAEAGLSEVATLEREPVPDIEPATRRAYVIARR
jgi:SAM-dependent methyltransferase